MRNHLIPGFEPTGVGAATLGFFRLPFFVERVQAYCDALHALDSTVTVQMVHQGGMPHGASNVMSAPVINLMPHVMDTDDIEAFVAEYAHSARLAMEGRADGVELHLSHDDLHEWFLSPFTNRRDDAYGGSLENRAGFATECLRAIRDVVGTSMTVGIRLNIREEVPEGYGVADGIELAQHFRLTPTGGALEAALELGRAIAANGPLAVRASKQVIVEAPEWGRAEMFDKQCEITLPVRESEDAREGATAFKEKRAPPRWQGR